MATAIRSSALRLGTGIVGGSERPPAKPVAEGVWRAAAVGVAALALVIRLAYLGWDCPYDLAPDEAHYWDWSRHLDWSYYSKGPGVAWLIAASTSIFGNHMWAVRLPAVVCGSLTLLGLYELTNRAYRSPQLAFGVVLLAVAVPTLAVGSILMTIDAPYLCTWMWALVVAHAACFPIRLRSELMSTSLWALLGLLIGVGILFKYTMVIFLPSLVLFGIGAWWFRIPEARRLASGPRLVALGLPLGLCLVPILIWNWQHEWVTFFHVGRQAGVENQGGVFWLGPLEYLAGQAGALFGFWFVFWIGGVLAALFTLGLSRDRQGADRSQTLFLLSFSLPMFLVFLAFSLKTRVELNWPVTAYLSGAVLTAGWVARNCTSSLVWWRRVSQLSLAAAASAGLIVVVLIHHTEWLYPLLRSPESAASVQAGPRAWDPTCRLRGWQTLAAEVERVRTELRAEGVEPILAGTGWSLPGELGFYLPDHPEVYSLALANGGRRSQYDFWRPNPIWDPEQFRGCTIICVGELSPRARSAFKRVEAPVHAVELVDGEPVAAWQITVCRDFRTFGPVTTYGY